MSLHITRFRLNQSLLLVLTAGCLSEKQQVSILQSLWLKPPIYRTRGEHTNHYTTDAVNVKGKTESFWRNIYLE